jgi:hypothetical protein
MFLNWFSQECLRVIPALKPLRVTMLSSRKLSHGRMWVGGWTAATEVLAFQILYMYVVSMEW